MCAKMQLIFYPLSLYTFVTICIADTLLYLKYLPQDTFYDKSQKSQMEL